MFIILFSILIGAIIGSFINVVIFRLPRAMCGENISLSLPRSFCPACGHVVRWRHNLPVVGWLMLKGACFDCRSPISRRYPLIEALMAAAFGWVVWQHGLTLHAGITLFALCLLVPLAFIDYDTQLLPDRLMYPLLAGGLIVAATGQGRIGWQEAAIAAVLGFALPWLLSKVFYLFYRREGLGMGDIKLFAALGVWMGYSLLWNIMIAACLLAMTFALLVLKIKPDTPFPFGPYPISITVYILLFY